MHVAVAEAELGPPILSHCWHQELQLLLLGWLWEWVWRECHGEKHSSARGMSSNQGEYLCFAALCHVQSCQHTSAHFPCQDGADRPDRNKHFPQSKACRCGIPRKHNLAPVAACTELPVNRTTMGQSSLPSTSLLLSLPCQQHTHQSNQSPGKPPVWWLFALELRS